MGAVRCSACAGRLEMADTTSQTANDTDGARSLLARIPALQRPCDLDLLVFFARHSRVLLSSEQLARLLGYPLKEIARSRDALVAAGLLTRVQDSGRAERMYIFEGRGMNGGPIPNVVKLASTPGGRVSLRRALKAGTHTTQPDTRPSRAGVSPRDIDSGNGSRTISPKGHND
jgi:hypothetical protein